MEKILRRVAEYHPGYGWYRKGLTGPDDPNCSPTDFFGINKKEALKAIADDLERGAVWDEED